MSSWGVGGGGDGGGADGAGDGRVGRPDRDDVVVLGEGEPVLGAVIWPAGAVTDEAIQACVNGVNKALPDYARIGSWLRARGEFASASGLATANGRPRRRAILDLHADLFSRASAYPLP